MNDADVLLDCDSMDRYTVYVRVLSCVILYGNSKKVRTIFVALLVLLWVPKMFVGFLGDCGNMDVNTISIRKQCCEFCFAN